MRFVQNSDQGGAGAVALPPSSRPARRSRRVAVGLVAGAALSLAAIVALRSARAPGAGERVDAQANAYVALALALGRIDASAVDTFFGPAALAPPTDRPAPTLADVRARASRLLGDISGDHAPAFAARRAALAGDVRLLLRLIDAMQAEKPQRFDEEARALYGVDVGAVDDRPRRAALAELATLLPGPEPLPKRVAAFRARLAVAPGRRAAVFAAALAECRRRTLAHWPLPSREHVDVRWDDAAPAAWHHYLGAGRSLLEVNMQAVAFVGAAIDTACHEAYPGHHAQFLAMEAAAPADSLPVEDRIVLLRSPASVLREGAANYGVRLAFPIAERTAFARDTLYPLAGLPPREAALDARVHQLLGELELSVVPILRAYRDGALSAEAAAAALRDEALIASPEALLRFTDQYGAFVIGYTIAADRVAAQVAARSARSHRDMWAVLHEIVATTDLSALAPVNEHSKARS